VGERVGVLGFKIENCNWSHPSQLSFQIVLSHLTKAARFEIEMISKYTDLPVEEIKKLSPKGN